MQDSIFAKYLVQAIAVVATVLAIRKATERPDGSNKIDGLVVIILAIPISGAVMYATGYAFLDALPAHFWPRFLAETFLCWGAAVGGTHLADRNGDRIPKKPGEADPPKNVAIVAPTQPTGSARTQPPGGPWPPGSP